MLTSQCVSMQTNCLQLSLRYYETALSAEITAQKFGDFGLQDWLKDEADADRDAVTVAMFGISFTDPRYQFMLPFNARMDLILPAPVNGGACCIAEPAKLPVFEIVFPENL